MVNPKWKEFTIQRKDAFKWNSDSSLEIYLNLLKNRIFPAIDKLVKDELIENYHFLTHIMPPNGTNLSGTKPGGLDFYILSTNKSQFLKICKILVENGIPTDYVDNPGDHSDTENSLKLNTELLRKVINQSNSPNELRKIYSNLIDCLIFLLFKERDLSHLLAIMQKYNVPDDFAELIEKLVNISLNQTKPVTQELFNHEIVHFLNNSIGMGRVFETSFLQQKDFGKSN